MPKLASIARDMENEARRRGIAYRELSRGLALQLNWINGQKTLRLSRPAVMPSEQEIDIIRSLFWVPNEAQESRSGTSITLRWSAT